MNNSGKPYWRAVLSGGYKDSRMLKTVVKHSAQRSLLKGQISSIIFSLATVFLPFTAFAVEAPDWKEIIHESQTYLTHSEPEQAEATLLELERIYPEVRKEPLFCYQRFFVALEGRGDRATAKLMLERLNHLVAQGTLAADSPIYLSVTETWYHSLFATNSDLARLAHQKMTQRRERLSKETAAAAAKEKAESTESTHEP
jgi:hypothetical protein